MTEEERRILTAWSKGNAGATPRLAKRAWWVLEDHERRPPGDLAGTWANASDAHVWILNFHSMGVVGLMDAPRKGRPSAHVQSIKTALECWMDQVPDEQKDKDRLTSLMKSLSKREKEALWRLNRRTGASLMRRRGGLNIPVPVSSGLSDLHCVHLGVGVKILAFFPQSSRHFDELNGLWLGVPKDILDHREARTVRPDLMEAMSVRVRVPSPPINTAGDASPILRKQEATLEQRALDHLSNIAHSKPGALVVHAFVDLLQGPALLRVLNGLRSRRLWPSGLRRSPGLLADLRVVPYERDWSNAAHSSLVDNLPNASSETILKFHDRLTRNRRDVFCWVRTADSDEPEPTSAWLERDVPDGVDD